MTGLTSTQAAEFLKRYGLNSIKEHKGTPLVIKFFEQFNNFLTILLLAAAGMSLWIGEPVDGGLIIAIVVLNGIFGLYQEYQAEQSLAVLKKMTTTNVRVIRDKQEQEIDSRYLVPQDIVKIEEGTKISADGQLIEAVNLEVNESVLTGESLSVAKKNQDRVYAGTIVAKGRGIYQVTATGMQTRFGKIAGTIEDIKESQTPLQLKLNRLTRLIGVVGIIISITVFIVSVARGSGYFPAFLLAISLAVAVVPEGLPAVMTITLAIGVKVMAGKRSIIRKLAAIEALGSITLIATDKTGTLTTNKMKVKELFVDNQSIGISSRQSRDQLKSVKISLNQLKSVSTDNNSFSLLLLNGILCSTASLVYVHDHNHWDVLGDPTEGALLYLAQAMGIEPEEVRKEWKIIDEKPFDSTTKTMSVIVQNQQTIQFTKGAPEAILEKASLIQEGKAVGKLTRQQRLKIEEQVRSWARKGLRVLGFGYQSVGDGSDGLIFLGLVAIHDAPRPEIKEAVRQAKLAGIKIVMITGDNEQTAEAIGVTAGIIDDNEDILTGKQIDQYSDEELMKILGRVRIFARTTPFHKHRLVRLYQNLGEIVAVTGDGVNDAIALKQADVGVAMGLVGTDVARETADMVITDDNFASIVNAVDEGRNIIKNLKNAIKYLLSCNIAEAIALIMGLVLGVSNLFYPIQLLYINLLTDGLPALVLAFSPRDYQQMRRPPDKKMDLLKPVEQSYIAIIGVFTALVVLAAYYFMGGLIDNRIGPTAAFTVLTLIQSFIFIDLWLSHQPIHKNHHLLRSPLFLLAFILPFIVQLIIVRVAWIAGLFKVAPVSIWQYAIMIVFASAILLAIKTTKIILKIHRI